MKYKIGFIGLGTMGLPMARNIIKNEYQLIVYDTNSSRIKLLASNNSVVRANSPGEVGKYADIVITMLPNPDIIKDVTVGKGDLFSNMGEGTIWIDMSTSDPVLTQGLGEQAAELGINSLDAPVARSSKEAETAELMIMVGGNEKDFAKVEPLLRLMGNDIFYCGPLGTGHTMKIVNNLLGMIVLEANNEALVLGTKAGLKINTMLEVLKKTNVWNRHLENTFPSTVFQRNFEPGYKTVLAEKDLGLAKQLATDVKTPLPCGMLVREMMTTAIAEGYGDENFTSIIKPLERIANVKIQYDNNIDL